MPKLLAIVGPTASGKSIAALQIAAGIGGEIVSADSRQVYKYLDIGTAKPSPEDRRKVPHHFVDFLSPETEYSAGEFGRDARGRIGEIFGRGGVPILVGGSGLYVKGVVDGFFEGPGKDPEIRLQLEAREKEEGAGALLETLRTVDPQSASLMGVSKPRRIIRALEVYYITGKPLSQYHNEQSSAPPFEVVQVAFSWPRDMLYDRINRRVDWMFSEGLVDEVERLRKMGYTAATNALNTVGYKEVFGLLAGKLGKDETIELVKRNSRRFAKRQLTWFKADKRIQWLRVNDNTGPADMTSEVLKVFNSA